MAGRYQLFNENISIVSAIANGHWYTPADSLPDNKITTCWVYIDTLEYTLVTGTNDIDSYLQVLLGKKDEIRKDVQLMIQMA